MLFGLKRIKNGMEKEYMRLLHAAPNFFKHADNDADDTLEFNPAGTEFVIFDAVETYNVLAVHITPLMTVFRFRFYISYTHLWGADIPPLLSKSFDVEILKSLTRKQFFNYFDTMLIRFVDKSVLGSSIPRWIVLCYILICYATG